MKNNTGTGRIRGTTPEMESAALRMRWQPTPAEARLWQALRGQKLNGLRFRHQHPVGSFILDFYCPACKLVVELDGAVHSSQQAADAARTQQLEAHGYRVIRFHNDQVFKDLDGVLRQIERAALAEPEATGPPNPPSFGGT